MQMHHNLHHNWLTFLEPVGDAGLPFSHFVHSAPKIYSTNFGVYNYVKGDELKRNTASRNFSLHGEVIQSNDRHQAYRHRLDYTSFAPTGHYHYQRHHQANRKSDTFSHTLKHHQNHQSQHFNQHHSHLDKHTFIMDNDNNSSDATAILNELLYDHASDTLTIGDYSSMSEHVKTRNDTAIITAVSMMDSLATINNIKLAAVVLCALLGALCILLNAFVITSLLANRRRVLRNVFYILVLHCALVDLIRGGCLIAYGLPHFLIINTTTMGPRLFALKINQFTLMILRSCNLLTIFNLLVFTTNEFIVIRFPLHYRRYFLRKTVLIILTLSWLISILFGVGSALSNFLRFAHSLIVLKPRSDSLPYDQSAFNSSVASSQKGTMDSVEYPSTLLMMMKRRETSDLPLNVICMLTSFFLCYVCLTIVLICYGTILNTIRNFHNTEKTSSSRKSSRFHGSSVGEKSRCFETKAQRSASLYQKRYHHDVLRKSTTDGSPQQSHHQHFCNHYSNRQQNTTNHHAGHNSNITSSNKPTASVTNVNANPSSTTSTPQGSIHHDDAAAAVHNNANRRCNSHRKWKSHLMSRHKYLIVIGTVLFVDILFLIPYSAIQMVAIVHLHRMIAASTQSTLIRWGLQILIGIHSVCQPLCYFRMNEFRRLACCNSGGRMNSRRFGGGSNSSASSTVIGIRKTRKRRGFFTRSKSMSNSRDLRTETETYALQSTSSVGNLTRSNEKVAKAPRKTTTDHSFEQTDSTSAQRRIYKQHKTSKASSISNSFNSKISALRRISSSSLVLQSACLITVDDIDGDKFEGDCELALIDGVYDYGTSRGMANTGICPYIAEESNSGIVVSDDESVNRLINNGTRCYKFHSVETIPSVSNEENSRDAINSGSASGQPFEACDSPMLNGVTAQVLNVDTHFKNTLSKKDDKNDENSVRIKQNRSQSAVTSNGFNLIYTLRRAFTFRRTVERSAQKFDKHNMTNSDDDDKHISDRLIEAAIYKSNEKFNDNSLPITSRFRRYGVQAQADLLAIEQRQARFSTLSDLRSSICEEQIDCAPYC